MVPTMPYADPIKRARSKKDWAAANRDKVNASGRRYYLKQLGLTPELASSQLAAQGYKCGVPTCQEPLTHHGADDETGRGARADHDHLNGKFRGFTCNDCNTAIVKLGDQFEGVIGAVAYLIKGDKQKLEQAISLLKHLSEKYYPQL